MIDDYAVYKHDKVIRFIDSIKNGWRKFPPSIQIGITDHCFNTCPMCGHWKRRNKSKLDADVLINFLAFGKSKGLESIGYSGGDPFAYSELNEVMKWHVDNDVAFGIVTAGYCPDWVDLELLRKASWVRASLDSADVSLYKKLRGGSLTSNKVLSSITRMIGAGIYVGVGCTITKYNIEPVSQIAEVITATKGIKELRFWLVRDHSDMSPTTEQKDRLAELLTVDLPGVDTNFKTIIKELKSTPEVIPIKYCYATLYQMFIDADGSIYPCCTVAGDTEQFARMRALGNINNKDICINWEWESKVWSRAVAFSKMKVLPDVCYDDCIPRHRIANKIAYDNWHIKSFQ